jgi:hypothetical protein
MESCEMQVRVSYLCLLSRAHQFFIEKGVAAQGLGTKVHLVNCVVTGHMESCVAAINGGAFILLDQYSFSLITGCIDIENSTLSDSLKLQGVVAQGLNSKVFLRNSSVFNCSGTCVLALQGGCVDIQNCKVFSSTTMQGVCAQGKGSTIRVLNSQVYGN